MVDTGVNKDKPAMFQEGSSMVRRNIERISNLSLDLLRYSKERELEPTVCNPGEIVAEAVELFKARAEEQGVKLHTVLSPDLKETCLDRDGIHRVLVNLISNAVDACVYDEDTSKAWEVTVKSEMAMNADSGEKIVFEVRDNGCGMTDEAQAKLFTKFFSTKAGRGTGLGLLITQNIVQEHGGEMSFESETGKGTTFTVRIPLQTPGRETDEPCKPHHHDDS
jgi:signal transduction histidine kinase